MSQYRVYASTDGGTEVIPVSTFLKMERDTKASEWAFIFSDDRTRVTVDYGNGCVTDYVLCVSSTKCCPHYPQHY